MFDFDYSIDARNIKSAFYDVDIMVYVEGQEDVPFWEFIFSKFYSKKFHVEEVDGKENLKKYMKEIIEGIGEFVVARDSDYDRIKGDCVYSKKILYTKGYSIENTMINSFSVEKVVRNLSLSAQRNLVHTDFSSWIFSIEKNIEPLIIVDIYAFLNNKGLAIMPHNADRFMRSKNSYELCSHLIGNYISSLDVSSIEGEIKKIYQSLEVNDCSVFDCINGHFLFSAAHRFVTLKSASFRKNFSSTKIQCSKDSFFGLLLSAFESAFDTNHSHYSYYKSIFHELSELGS